MLKQTRGEEALEAQNMIIPLNQKFTPPPIKSKNSPTSDNILAINE